MEIPATLPPYKPPPLCERCKRQAYAFIQYGLLLCADCLLAEVALRHGNGHGGEEVVPSSPSLISAEAAASPQVITLARKSPETRRTGRLRGDGPSLNTRTSPC